MNLYLGSAPKSVSTATPLRPALGIGIRKILKPSQPRLSTKGFVTIDTPKCIAQGMPQLLLLSGLNKTPHIEV